MTVPPAPVPVSSQTPFARVSCQSTNEAIPGVVHRSPGIYLTAEENPGKPQLGDISDEGSAPSDRLNFQKFCFSIFTFSLMSAGIMLIRTDVNLIMHEDNCLNSNFCITNKL